MSLNIAGDPVGMEQGRGAYQGARTWGILDIRSLLTDREPANGSVRIVVPVPHIYQPLYRLGLWGLENVTFDIGFDGVCVLRDSGSA